MQDSDPSQPHPKILIHSLRCRVKVVTNLGWLPFLKWVHPKQERYVQSNNTGDKITLLRGLRLSLSLALIKLCSFTFGAIWKVQGWRCLHFCVRVLSGATGGVCQSTWAMTQRQKWWNMSPLQDSPKWILSDKTSKLPQIKSHPNLFQTAEIYSWDQTAKFPGNLESVRI